jgi:hypothetical protein
MAGKAGLKAGLIGLAILLAMTLINQLLPISGGLVYALCGVNMLIYAGIGVLAGFFLAPPRAAGSGAGAGAIAGLISGLVNGVVGYVITAVRMARGMGLPGVAWIRWCLPFQARSVAWPSALAWQPSAGRSLPPSSLTRDGEPSCIWWRVQVPGTFNSRPKATGCPSCFLCLKLAKCLAPVPLRG